MFQFPFFPSSTFLCQVNRETFVTFFKDNKQITQRETAFAKIQNGVLYNVACQFRRNGMAKYQELQLIGSRISLRGIKANAVGKHILGHDTYGLCLKDIGILTHLLSNILMYSETTCEQGKKNMLFINTI